MTRSVLPNAGLLSKYDRPVPRYTSYPTVPYWKEGISKETWRHDVQQRFSTAHLEGGIALYIHLPFCETLCTYCGCNKKITRRHSVEGPYIESLLREWSIYRSWATRKLLIREIHLGGGTPTFFSAGNLRLLIEGLLEHCTVAEDAAFSIEGHPNNTTADHLRTLASLGFNRISYGVQDLDPKVQVAINRIQPFQHVLTAVENARAAGFGSVNLDLVYGLPFQSIEGLRHTIEQVLSLKPDRIAFYSYAHVPWKSRSQRLYDEKDLPPAAEKLQLQELGRALFREHGYEDIGMDHFALPTDELYTARKEGRLHRNFMGYTVTASSMLIGLGVSAISDTGTALVQNEKELSNYVAAVGRRETAVYRGHFLSEEDQLFRRYILDIACKGETILQEKFAGLVNEHCLPALTDMEKDGLVSVSSQTITLTSMGRYFLRNVCAAFDIYLQQSASGRPAFSKSI